MSAVKKPQRYEVDHRPSPGATLYTYIGTARELCYGRSWANRWGYGVGADSKIMLYVMVGEITESGAASVKKFVQPWNVEWASKINLDWVLRQIVSQLPGHTEIREVEGEK